MNKREMLEDSVEQRRINRINSLLDRLDKIPHELDEIHDKLFNPSGFNRNEYAALVDRRNALLIEHDRVENELKKVYKMKQL